MSWVSRAVEERLAIAAAAGELAAPEHLKGKPIADIDLVRPAGWWAEQFAARELSHDRRADAQRAVDAARSRFWRCTDEASLRAAVADVNAGIDDANRNLITSDRLDHFDVDDVLARWRNIRR